MSDTIITLAKVLINIQLGDVISNVVTKTKLSRKTVDRVIKQLEHRGCIRLNREGNTSIIEWFSVDAWNVADDLIDAIKEADDKFGYP